MPLPATQLCSSRFTALAPRFLAFGLVLVLALQALSVSRGIVPAGLPLFQCIPVAHDHTVCASLHSDLSAAHASAPHSHHHGDCAEAQLRFAPSIRLVNAEAHTPSSPIECGQRNTHSDAGCEQSEVSQPCAQSHHCACHRHVPLPGPFEGVATSPLHSSNALHAALVAATSLFEVAQVPITMGVRRFFAVPAPTAAHDLLSAHVRLQV